MRWTKPKTMDIRIKQNFLILPLKINNEIRWLEKVRIKQQYNILDNHEESISIYGWTNVEFLDL